MTAAERIHRQNCRAVQQVTTYTVQPIPFHGNQGRPKGSKNRNGYNRKEAHDRRP